MTETRPGLRRFNAEVLRSVLPRIEGSGGFFTVHVSDGLSERVFYFVPGAVRMISAGRDVAPDIPEYLYDRGEIDTLQFDRLQRLAQSRDEDLRVHLDKMGILDGGEFAQVSLELVREQLMGLVFWEDAYSAVYTGPPPQEVFSLERPPLSASFEGPDLSHALEQWLDFWHESRAMLHGERAVFTVDSEGREWLVENRSDLSDIIDACTEAASLATIRGETGRPIFQLCRELRDFIENGCLTVEPPVAQRRRSDHLARASEIEANLPNLAGKSLAREKLVDLYQKASEPERAVEQLDALAKDALDDGAWQEACDRWRKLLKLDAGHFDAFKSLVRALKKNGRRADIAAEAQQLAPALKELTCPSTLHNYAKLLNLIEGTEAVLEQVHATIFALKSDQRKKTHDGAIKKHIVMASKLEARGDLVRAERLLKKALTFDPQNEHLRERLESLGQKPGRRRLPSWGLVAAAAVAVAATVYFAFPELFSGAGKDGPVAHAAGTTRKDEAPAPKVETPTRTASKSTTAQKPPTPPADRGPRRRPFDAADDQPDSGLPVRVTGLRSSDPCEPHAGLHLATTRLLDDRHRVTFGDSCSLVVSNAVTGKPVMELWGEARTGWALSPCGNVIAQWGPGRPLSLTRNLTADKTQVLGWNLPEETLAVAVGIGMVAFRTPEGTRVVRFDGTVVAKRRLPEWTEGVVARDTLVFVGTPGGPGKRKLLVTAYHPETLQVLWSFLQ